MYIVCRCSVLYVDAIWSYNHKIEIKAYLLTRRVISVWMLMVSLPAFQAHVAKNSYCFYGPAGYKGLMTRPSQWQTQDFIMEAV